MILIITSSGLSGIIKHQKPEEAGGGSEDKSPVSTGGKKTIKIPRVSSTAPISLNTAGPSGVKPTEPISLNTAGPSGVTSNPTLRLNRPKLILTGSKKEVFLSLPPAPQIIPALVKPSQDPILAEFQSLMPVFPAEIWKEMGYDFSGEPPTQKSLDWFKARPKEVRDSLILIPMKGGIAVDTIAKKLNQLVGSGKIGDITLSDPFDDTVATINEFSKLCGATLEGDAYYFVGREAFPGSIGKKRIEAPRYLSPHGLELIDPALAFLAPALTRAVTDNTATCFTKAQVLTNSPHRIVIFGGVDLIATIDPNDPGLLSVDIQYGFGAMKVAD